MTCSEQNGALSEQVVALTAEVEGGEQDRRAQGEESEKMKEALAAAKAETAQVRAEMGEKEKILAETTEEQVGEREMGDGQIMLQGMMKSVQEELKRFKEEQTELQTKYEQVLKSNEDLARENESLKRDMKETKEQLADDVPVGGGGEA